MCGRAHNGEYKQGTSSCFGYGKSGLMVKDYPKNRDQAGCNAQPRPNQQGAAVVEALKGKRFYVLKGREEKEKFANVAIGVL